MKAILVLLPIAAVAFSCGSPRKTHAGSENPTTRAMRGSSGSAADASDTITVTGTQTLPILGRNEAGVRPDIEGTWVLQSSAVPVATNTNNITSGKSLAADESGKEYTGRIIDETMKGSKEVRRDTTTTTADGVTHTSTTVYLINKDAEGKKITPPQSSNPNVHMPERPSLRFYGSNETFSGFTGCNKISGRYTMRGNSISFHNASPSTKMACIGEYNENAFLSSLRRINSFRSTGGRLELMDGNDVVMVFSRK